MKLAPSPLTQRTVLAEGLGLLEIGVGMHSA
jgi:hypothetical protein